MFRIKHQFFCHNCGKSNHKFANCNEPLSSYGLIAYYENKLVLVRRKFSFAFINFIMGKYDINDINYITLLFSRMTNREIRLIIKKLDFDELRRISGLTNFTRAHKHEYDNSKVKFTYIKNMKILEEVIYNIDALFSPVDNQNNNQFKFVDLLLNNSDNDNSNDNTNSNNNENGIKNPINQEKRFKVTKETIIKLRKIITTTQIYDEPEWELPKGKRAEKETNFNTAIREFIEETAIDNISVFKNIIPLEEEFIALNGNRYKHIYYLANVKGLNKQDINNSDTTTPDDIIIPPDINNKEQIKEIGAVGLISINNLDNYLRPYQIEKKKVIYKSFQIINNYSVFFE